LIRIVFIKVLPHYHHVVNIFEVDTSYLPVVRLRAEVFTVDALLCSPGGGGGGFLVIVADINYPYSMRKYVYEQQQFEIAHDDTEEENAATEGEADSSAAR
jgi:hypothetical protein